MPARLVAPVQPSEALAGRPPETELSVLGRQCRDRRIAEREILARAVGAWEEKRNAAVVKVDWQFTTADARIKLKRLYPSIQLSVEPLGRRNGSLSYLPEVARQGKSRAISRKDGHLSAKATRAGTGRFGQMASLRGTEIVAVPLSEAVSANRRLDLRYYEEAKEFVEHGLEAALSRKKPTGRQYRKLDGHPEARLIGVACSPPPEGQVRWTLTLLADKLVELAVVQSISAECVRTTLKKRSQAVADVVVVGEERLQAVGEVGVPGQEHGPIRRGAGRAGGQVLGDGLIDALVTVVAGRHGVTPVRGGFPAAVATHA